MNWSEHFYYDESSPTGLRWARNVMRGRHLLILFKSVGEVAGSFGKGYSHVCTNGKVYKTSRVIWEMHNGWLDPKLDIDHRDGNKHNKIDNLRAVSTAINTRNSKMRCDNTSGVVGVSLVTKPSGHVYWRAVWYTIEHKRRERYFSVAKLGDNAAKAAASACTSEAKRELNASGAGYTQRHGVK
jgi:hypothetical protein